MQKWEYMVIHGHISKGMSFADVYQVGESNQPYPANPGGIPIVPLHSLLQRYGDDGWEVVSITQGLDTGLILSWIPFLNKSLVVIAKRPKE